MDVIWLKKDIRIHDHGPLSEIINSERPFCILYLFEPDQLSEPTVHGSHISFINESLIDLDQKLASSFCEKKDSSNNINGNTAGRNIDDDSHGLKSSACNHNLKSSTQNYTFQVLTVCHANAVYTMNNINRQKRIHRLLSHEETGHMKSFIRDKTLRKWCKAHSVPFIEFNQNGVTRCLKKRDDFAKQLNSFIMQPLYEMQPDKMTRIGSSQSLISSSNSTHHESINDDFYENYTKILSNICKKQVVISLNLHGKLKHPIQFHELTEIPEHHREDRIERQMGGESQALKTLHSFLSSRAGQYSKGISSPNTSWQSGSRLSPYLTWGNVSLRFVIQRTRQKQAQLREQKKIKNTKWTNHSASTDVTATASSPNNDETNSPWLKSLAAFSSRMHWRSHFTQKLESEPQIEKQDLCPAYQHLRRSENDWNESYYEAWATGKTGFPFVDACMRCLLKHGWINFRMRAMLVSFATYNLWLDWKRIAPHLARVFLDFEPGIHYPQIQMQSGTTGINAMRVYNVTKQGRDQDPNGIFIRKYVSELKSVPLKYLHEPSKMSFSLQEKIQVYIGIGTHIGNESILCKTNRDDIIGSTSYPAPIVNEVETAKAAKDRVNAVRKLDTTKRLAEQVYDKHGSRSNRNSDMNGLKPKALSSSIKRVKVHKGQKTLKDMFHHTQIAMISENGGKFDAQSGSPLPSESKRVNVVINQVKGVEPLRVAKTQDKNGWNCKACTYLNEKPLALACSICGSLK